MEGLDAQGTPGGNSFDASGHAYLTICECPPEALNHLDNRRGLSPRSKGFASWPSFSTF